MIHYQDDRVTLHHANCLDTLAGMPDNSVDSIVTDPPYGLSNTDPRHVTEAIGRWIAGDRAYVPDLRGFMGAAWDAFVPPPAVWDQCLRVLKPGGHALVFSSSRTTDLMTLSLRLAGFEIRDSIAWLYGGAMPKSLDIGKAIDKTRDDKACILTVTRWLADERDTAGLTNRDIDDTFGTAGMAGHWTSAASQPAVPKWDQWLQLKELIGFNGDMDAEVWRLNGRKGTPGDAWEQREVIGVRTTGIGTGKGSVTIMGDADNHDITAPATPAARQWEGWGTGLRPSMELICVARKPLIGTVAANVQEWGTGAINIDATRIPTSDSLYRETSCASDSERHDGYDRPWKHDEATRASGSMAGALGDHSSIGYDDTGGPSRFFPVMKYQAKAPQKERPSYTDATGRKIAHPTVKPLALLRWVTRLVTQSGGLCLDPFAGSGTTIEAAILEGFRVVGVEQDETYLPLIMTRIQRANEVEPASEGMFEAQTPVKKGRWPANVVMDKDTAAALDEETGNRPGFSGGGTKGAGFRTQYVGGDRKETDLPAVTYNDTGGASRFFGVFDAEADTADVPLFDIEEAI